MNNMNSSPTEDDMKFRYYITDIFDGAVKGTNSDEDAANYACSEYILVMDAESGQWLQACGERAEMQDAIA